MMISVIVMAFIFPLAQVSERWCCKDVTQSLSAIKTSFIGKCFWLQEGILFLGGLSVCSVWHIVCPQFLCVER